ncbi:Transducin family protein / WD-40 repeat family protein, putative isoform 2 [Hibiscus syriacus]|uniref:Transducin family protein / WD-40 repeat family protein, putative isoform 2 n=1 Tax=Hibiscus syriacus TaxID=106335 RepID=A0A6A3B4F4_HIBSY|nr:Transducin family protein / WD-40 repeat family protein, putative isoform 2 [Hibiscus syriacus]
MFAKRLLQKADHHPQRGDLKSEDLDLRVAIHYGIPSTSSVLAFDPIQRLLAIGTLDGRIKVIGGDGIEGLLISPKQLPYKYLEFIQNQGFLIGISNDNDIQVWNLEDRCLACCLPWESNITAFCLIGGSHFMYIGNEYGLLSVVKFDGEDGKLSHLPYNISANSLSEASELSVPDDQPIVGILPQPHSSGDRVLIAYGNGLIILWDVSKSQSPFIGGGKDLQLKDAVDSDVQDDTSEHHLQEKEISAICWASSDGSILAVGYIDGDILFWNTSVASSKGERNGQNKNVVKLQLSSAERRLPVIVLQWSSNNSSRNDYDNLLFIYGGDEIGSEEVLTVLSLEWSSGMDNVRCVGRVDLTLTGSFADMILLPTPGPTGGNYKADLFVLTNPGQLHLYDGTNLSTLLSKKERKQFARPVEFPMVIRTADPPKTVGKFSVLPTGGNSSKSLSELASIMKPGLTPNTTASTKWPLTGGVPTQLSVSKDNSIDRLYIAGYRDGSVRIWDASYPILTLLFVLEGEVQGTDVAGSDAPVTTLDFCWQTLNLAVGNECGVVRVYNLGNSNTTSFHYVTETKCEVQSCARGKGPECKAVFSLLKSPVQALQFGNCGAKLAVGFGFGRVAMLDVSLPASLFVTDCVSSSSSPIISLSWLEFKNAHSHVKSTEQSETEIAVKPEEEIIFILTKDAKIFSIDGANGEMIQPHPWNLKKEETALSMYIIGNSFPVLNREKHLEESSKDITVKGEAELDASSTETEHPSSSETASTLDRSLDMLFLLCCQNSLRLFSMKSLIQGKDKTIHKVNHTKPCCWTTTFMKDGRVCGLLLLFQTGDLEIRSLPDLELVKESSIKSILRWNYKANMDKLMTSDDAQLTLTSGCEVAFISLLAGSNDFRIPEALPCLHDRVLAAAADAAINFSSNQKKKQVMASGILGGMVKGFKGGKVNTSATPESDFSLLESKFLKTPFIDAMQKVNKQEDIELDIDDIDIDETLPVTSSSSHEAVKSKGGKETDREKLLGAQDDSTPRVRTAQEIIAKYRKTGDASSAASHARDKLAERGEKLQRISRRTEELQSGAENFASLADELVKAMENRKWWQV